MTSIPLAAWHQEKGAKMCLFAGYSMPIQYKGIIIEHLHTRSKASLFDVSHMGHVVLHGDEVSKLETLVPNDIKGLKSGRLRYSFLTNPAGGIIDDMMVGCLGDTLHLVVNASRKELDFNHMVDHGLTPVLQTNSAILALQGPASQKVLENLVPAVREMRFLDFGRYEWKGLTLLISRSGYTGEDGFEIICDAHYVDALATALTDHEDVALAGLGARDTLRLEAGLCLYGQDLTEEITPIEADLLWAIGPRRRIEGGYAGSDQITREMNQGPMRRRVGLRLEGQLPARAGAVIRSMEGDTLGQVTSGGYAPTLERPIAMGYVSDPTLKKVKIVVRDKQIEAEIVTLPFVPHRYKK